VTTAALVKRLAALEAKRPAAQPMAEVERPLTEAEFASLVIAHLRDGGLEHNGERWIAQRGFYTEHDCAIIAGALNDWRTISDGAEAEINRLKVELAEARSGVLVPAF
jgi:hypothetical protein